eukprot:TRINITY_DN3100_c0_g1_i1.p1 TRINITY_DN3100_c0_g1~~TRINITY_DN3100_c0_g1_i1.p1  ORF type:complete len:440 (+),score=51.64 TRINITY_DN3100_c0_g1_i1:162-1481(+)
MSHILGVDTLSGNLTAVGFTDTQLRVLASITTAVSALSLCGSLFIIICYLSLRKMKRFSFKLVCMLSLSDIGSCVANILGEPSAGPLCYTQALLTSFFELASCLWTLSIAITLFLTVVRHQQDVERFEKWYHLGCWGIALLMTLLPLATDSYGSAGAGCWLKSDNVGALWRFFQFYFFLWSVFIIQIVMYLLIFREVRNSVNVFGGATGNAVKRMGLYPLILIICYSWATVNRIQNYIAPDTPLFWLYLLHVLFEDMVGLFNAFAYGSQRILRDELRDAGRRLLARCGYRDNSDDAMGLTADDPYEFDIPQQIVMPAMPTAEVPTSKRVAARFASAPLGLPVSRTSEIPRVMVEMSEVKATPQIILSKNEALPQPSIARSVSGVSLERLQRMPRNLSSNSLDRTNSGTLTTPSTQLPVVSDGREEESKSTHTTPFSDTW